MVLCQFISKPLLRPAQSVGNVAGGQAGDMQSILSICIGRIDSCTALHNLFRHPEVHLADGLQQGSRPLGGMGNVRTFLK